MQPHGDDTRTGNNNDAAKHYSVCEWASGYTIFCVKASDTACDWSLQESCKLLMAYSQLLLFQRILWATETAQFWQNLCMYPSTEHYQSIDLTSEEASVSYPECILWATVH